MKLYRSIGLGGTFDHFHIGHQFFLEFAAELADYVLVGVTTPELSQHKAAAHLIEAFDVRKRAVEQFLQDRGIHGEVFALSDPYGPTLENSKVEAVAVTEQTVPGAEAINMKRAALSLPALPVHACTLLRDEHGELISSTRIRIGEVDRTGRIYRQTLHPDIPLTAEQSQFFHAAQGPVVLSVNPSQLTDTVLTIGDVVSETFLKEQWPVQLAVFDQMSERKDYQSSHLQPTKNIPILVNPRGVISKEVIDWLANFFHQVTNKKGQSRQLLCIAGEEDLVTVAAVILAPLGTNIFYGQPGEGMVHLIVTEELKKRFADVMSA